MANASEHHDHDASTANPTFDLASLGSERLLVLFSGVAALGFGALALVLNLMGQNLPLSGVAGLGSAVFSFAVAAVFGLGMLLAYNKMGRNASEGSILALAFSIVLLAFGDCRASSQASSASWARSRASCATCGSSREQFLIPAADPRQ